MMRVLILSLFVLMASCGKVAETAVRSVAGAALGVDGGPSLSADLQAGKINSRSTLGDSKATDIRVAPVLRDNAFETLNQDNRTSADERTVAADRVETVYVTQNQVPAWLLPAMFVLFALVLFIAYLAPSPHWFRRWTGS